MRKTDKALAKASKPRRFTIKSVAPIQKGGRAEITFDWQQIDRLLEAGCPGSEVAAAIGVHHDTLYDRVVRDKGMSFSDYSAKMRAKGESCLRYAQHEKALDSKDNTMLIWLGKQRLEQREPETRQQTHVSLEQLDSIKQIFEQITKMQK